MASYARLVLKGTLTKEDFFRLYKQCKDTRLRERYQALYLGFFYPWKEVARNVCVTYETVLEWVQLYNECGLEGLLPDRQPGRPSSISAEQIKQVKEVVKQSPRTLGLRFSNWTLWRIAEWITDRFGVVLCGERIRQILHTIGFSHIKPAFTYILANRKERKAFLSDFEEVANSGGSFLFADEASVSQHPTLHGMWVLKGTTVKIRTFGNHVKRHVFAAVNPVTGEAVSMVTKRLNAEASLRFFKRLVDSTTEPVILFLDNSQCHKAKKVQDFLELHKDRIRVKWLPKYSPDLNPAEQVWKDMKHNVSHNYLFGTANKLAWGMRGYFRQLAPERVRSLCSPDYLLAKL